MLNQLKHILLLSLLISLAACSFDEEPENTQETQAATSVNPQTPDNDENDSGANNNPTEETEELNNNDEMPVVEVDIQEPVNDPAEEGNGPQEPVNDPAEESNDPNSNSNPENSPTTSFETISISGSNNQLIDGSFDSVAEEVLLNSGTQSSRSILMGGFGSQSRCGLDGEVIKVTNLNDSGPGSLRNAIETNRARTIVFEVSGAIRLRSPLIIEHPFVTIAGQTAPPPGIALHHSRLRVHAHDVCIQHIRVRHGDLTANNQLMDERLANEADAIIIRGRSEKPVFNVVLDNISTSWSIDETIAIYGTTSDVTIRDSIIAEPLKYSLHNRNHAYCMLIKDSVRRVSIIGNLFSQCQRRNPRMDGGSLQYVNNYVYNPGEYAVHVHDDDIDVSMVANILEFPQDDQLQWNNEGAREFFANRSTRTNLFIEHNLIPEDKILHQARAQGSSALVQNSPRVWDGSVTVLNPEEVRQHLLTWVGAFPSNRDVNDERVVSDIINRVGSYIDSQSDIGGYDFLEQNYRSLQLPENPQADDNNNGISNLVEWLQSFTDEIE